MKKGRAQNFEEQKGKGKRGRKSNWENRSRYDPDFDVNYLIRRLLSP
jgi:hypothetical protein